MQEIAFLRIYNESNEYKSFCYMTFIHCLSQQNIMINVFCDNILLLCCCRVVDCVIIIALLYLYDTFSLYSSIFGGIHALLVL